MKNTLSIKAFFVLGLVFALSAITTTSYAQVTNGDDDAGANAEVSGISNGDEDTVASSGSITNGEDDTSVTTTPGPTPAVSNGDDDISTTPAPVPTPGITNGEDDTSAPVVIVNNPENNDDTPRSSTGGRSRNRNTNRDVVVGGNTNSPVIPCAPIAQFLKLGANNSIVEVTKLQQFLQNVEKFEVAVTGVYDAQTIEAVKAFQVKYQSEILSPWGATIPSGQVYITTLTKINSLICNTPFVLSGEALSTIGSRTLGSAISGSVGVAAGRSVTAGNSASSGASQVGTGANGKTNSSANVAAAAKGNSGLKTFFTKIFNFIFGK